MTVTKITNVNQNDRYTKMTLIPKWPLFLHQNDCYPKMTVIFYRNRRFYTKMTFVTWTKLTIIEKKFHNGHFGAKSAVFWDNGHFGKR